MDNPTSQVRRVTPLDRDRLDVRIKDARELLAEIPDDETVDYPAYFGRLEVALRLLADSAEVMGAAQLRSRIDAGRLVAIRGVLAVLDSETGDRQMALERIARIVDGAR